MSSVGTKQGTRRAVCIDRLTTMDYLTSPAIAETDTSLEAQVAWHFACYCEPSIPQYMVPFALNAISYAVHDRWDNLLQPPEGVTWRGLTEVSVRNVIESLHLDEFVESELKSG